MALKTIPWDAADYLDTPEERSLLISKQSSKTATPLLLQPHSVTSPVPRV